jgi:hypothetical protein
MAPPGPLALRRREERRQHLRRPAPRPQVAAMEHRGLRWLADPHALAPSCLMRISCFMIRSMARLASRYDFALTYSSIKALYSAHSRIRARPARIITSRRARIPSRLASRRRKRLMASPPRSPSRLAAPAWRPARPSTRRLRLDRRTLPCSCFIDSLGVASALHRPPKPEVSPLQLAHSNGFRSVII